MATSGDGQVVGAVHRSGGDTVYDDDSGTYEVRTTSLWIPASTFQACIGTPALTPDNRRIYWALDPASAEALTATLFLPSHWATYDAEIWWTELAGGSGNVAWRLDFVNNVADGQTQSQATGAPSNAVAAAPSARVMEVTVGRSGLTNDGVSGVSLVVLRIANDAADTYASDVMFAGVRLLKVS